MIFILPMLYEILVVGCTDKEPDVDSAHIVLDTSEEYSVCVESGASGHVEGTIDCNQGICRVPEGNFWMGSALIEDECPTQEIFLSAYSIDQYEVRIQDWEQCVATQGCPAIPTHCMDMLRGRFDYTTNFPAICVTWDAAQYYCEKQGGRLPTEAEWEKAASGTQSSKWAWGSQHPDCTLANFRLASIYCYDGVSPVGRYTQQSAFGLYDVNGNVFEWVVDLYDADAYVDMDARDPSKIDGSCRNTVDGVERACVNRGLRGGAYNTTDFSIRNASRSYAHPTTVDVNIGLRCVYAN